MSDISHRKYLASVMKKAELGSSEDQVRLGQMYRQGTTGVAQDYGNALNLFKKALDQGNRDGKLDFFSLLEKLSKRNRIIIIGEPGVGKRTLLKTFLSSLSCTNADLGTGFFLEKRITEYYPSYGDYAFSVLDIRLEGDIKSYINKVKHYIASRSGSFFEKGRILVWYCVPAGEPRRLGPETVMLINAIHTCRVPILIVITKGRYFLNGDVRFWTADSQFLRLAWDSVYGQVAAAVLTRAKEGKFRNDNNEVVISKREGIDKLKILTDGLFHLLKQ